MLTDTSHLPIHAVLPILIETMKTHPAVVLTAPPGAGKSTVVPLSILDAGLLSEGRLLMLEPRRIAARACAQRMAQIVGERVGESVGFRVRFDARASEKTRILVVTEGVLTRRLVADPFLDGISVVILDEFHERSVHVDLALAFLSELLAVRDDLRLVVMSATLDAEQVSGFLSSCPIVSCPGEPFPVTISYDEASHQGLWLERAARAVVSAVHEAPDEGDVLVFMPGVSEIRRLEALLGSDSSLAGFDVIPLYGALSHREQDRALSVGVRRRIVIATNIAETSLTIPRVTAVVDNGLKKEIRFDPNLGLDRLETTAISLDSADQRAGRAGRIGPGWVRRLWSLHEEKGRPRRNIPEISRVDAAPVLLQILAFRPGDPRHYPLLDKPDARAMENGMALLVRLGAVVEGDFALTPQGRALAALPVHPRIGAILLRAAELGASEMGAAVAALVSERDILPRAESRDAVSPLETDFDYRVDLLFKFEAGGADRQSARSLGISFHRASFAANAKAQLLRSVGKLPAAQATEASITPGRLLLSGFPDRLIRLKHRKSREGVMVGGRGVRLASERSGDVAGELFIAVQVDAGRRTDRARGTVFQVSPVTPADLAAEHPSLLHNRRRTFFDRDKRAVVTLDEKCFLDLVLEETPCSTPGTDETADILAEAASERWEALFKPSSTTDNLIARVRYASMVMPELELPDLSEAGLKQMLPEICFGMRRLDEVAAIDWLRAISQRIAYPARVTLDTAFPERQQVPSGRSIPIDYGATTRDASKTPVLACRLQELFGLVETPTIAGGRIPLTLHLLAPNGRPCQITTDLKSFWENAYAEVRATLRGRYPKHYWPLDPFAATPTHRVRPDP